MSKKPFLQKLLDSVASEVAAGKAPAVAKMETAAAPVVRPTPVVPAGPVVDPLAELQKHMQSIQNAHAQAEREARTGYLELLRRYAPAPALDAHALAAPPAAPVPPMPEVLAVLGAAKKTPDDLARDVKTWSELREKADLVAQWSALKRAESDADEAVRAARAEFEKVQKEWEAKIDALRDVALRATSRRWAADQASLALLKVHGLDQELRALEWPMIADRARATPEDLAAEQAACDARDRICERSVHRGAFDPVFFPPPPPARDPNVTYSEGWSYTYHPRSDT